MQNIRKIQQEEHILGLHACSSHMHQTALSKIVINFPNFLCNFMHFSPFLKKLPCCIHVLKYALVGPYNNVCSFLTKNWGKNDPY